MDEDRAVASKYLVPYVLLIAFQYVVAKDALNYASPTGVEVVVCGLTFAVLFALAGGRVALTRPMLAFSAFFWLSGVCWFFSLLYISAAQSAILAFTMPLFAIPLSVFTLGERASRLEVYGGIVGFLGVILFNLPPLLGGAVEILGVSLALAGGFCWAAFSVYMKKFGGQSPVRTLATGFMSCTALWAVLSLFSFQFHPSLDLGFDIVYLSVGASVIGLYLWAALLKSYRITKLTVLIFITPVITLAYSIATTGAVPNYLTLAGVGLIFAGIYTSNMLGRGANRPAVVPEPTKIMARPDPTIENDS